MYKKSIYLGIIAALIFMLAACGGGNNTSSSSAQENWPDEEITIIVPFSVGGSADRQARAMANIIQEDLDTSVIVENREGGGGASGTNAHKHNDADDGTYLLYQSHPHFEAGIVRGAGYDFDDFDVLGITHSSPIAIWVDESSEHETIEDLINDMEANPGNLSYGMISSSWSDIAVKIVLDELGLDARAVPYDGGGPMRTALMGGEVDFIASDVEGTLAGGGEDLRPLAIFSEEPYEHAADIPLINDEMDQMGMGAEFPALSNQRFVQIKSEFKEEYPERWEKLETVFEKTVKSDEFKEWGENQSMYFNWIASEEATDMLRETVEIIYEYEDLFQ